MLTTLENDIIKRVSKADQDGVIYITAEEFVELYSGKQISLEHYLDLLPFYCRSVAILGCSARFSLFPR